MAYGRWHLELAMNLCKIHSQHGLYYGFEHPRYASSWQTSCVVNRTNNTTAKKVNADMCQPGMEIENDDGNEEASEEAYIFHEQVRTDAETKREVAMANMRICAFYSGGNASKAQVYPDKMCKDILKGLKAQLEEDGRMDERGMA